MTHKKNPARPRFLTVTAETLHSHSSIVALGVAIILLDNMTGPHLNCASFMAVGRFLGAYPSLLRCKCLIGPQLATLSVDRKSDA